MKRKIMIYGGVCLAMVASIAVLGLAGPFVVSLLLELASRRYCTQ